MPRLEISQRTFNGGELDPALHGRSDLEKHGTGAEFMENLVARPHGGAYKRPGLHCIAEALESDKPVRLIPFTFSIVQSYMLEFGDRRMRVIKDGALVAYPEGHARAGQPVVIDTPYAAEDLSRLVFAQTADLMILSHSNYRLRKLKRLDHHDWQFEEFNFGSGAVAAPTALRLTKDGMNGAAYCVSTVRGGKESIASDIAACGLASGNTLPVPDYYSLSIEQCKRLWVDTYKQKWPTEWDAWNMTTWEKTQTFLVTVLGYTFIEGYGDKNGFLWRMQRPNGSATELWMSNAALSSAAIIEHWRVEMLEGMNQDCGGVLTAMRGKIRDYVERTNSGGIATGISTLTWKAAAGAEKYNIYRASNQAGPYYYLGTTTGAAFTDNNLVADASRGPALSENPFAEAVANPGVCTFFEQRLFLARTNAKPATFWGSRIGVFDDFGKHSPIQDDDAYEFTLANGESNEILWAIPLNGILLGTSGSEWKADGNGSAITPTNINVRAQSMYGCAPIPPAVVGRSVVFAAHSRRVLRDFAYSLDADGFAGEDLTLFASHLFEERRIVAFCRQKDPIPVLWVVMDDGVLLSCTYLPDQRVVCWSRHATQGKFGACAGLVGANGIDRVYFTVTRSIGGRDVRFVEIMSDSLVPAADAAEAFYVDCGLTYRGEATTSLAGLDHLEGKTVDILADGNHQRAIVANGRVTLEYPAETVHAGLGYEATLDTLDLRNPQAPVVARPHSITKLEITLFRTASCRAGPVGERGDEVLRAEGEGWPKLHTGKFSFLPEKPKDRNGFRVRLRSDQPYPLCIVGIEAVGEAGGQ